MGSVSDDLCSVLFGVMFWGTRLVIPCWCCNNMFFLESFVVFLDLVWNPNCPVCVSSKPKVQYIEFVTDGHSYKLYILLFVFWPQVWIFNFDLCTLFDLGDLWWWTFFISYKSPMRVTNSLVCNFKTIKCTISQLYFHGWRNSKAQHTNHKN